MTTAHRPTFDPARGREALRGPAYHQRLAPAHTYLKTRQPGQGGDADPQAQGADLRAQLLDAEKAHFAKAGISTPSKGIQDGVKVEAVESEEDIEAKRQRVLEETRAIDAASDSNKDSDSEDSSDDSDEDETAELLRELEKIKRERADKKEAEERERAVKDQEERESDIAYGNPLLDPRKEDGGSKKRRWDEDVVFRNQARGTETRGTKAEFVNDLLRSDFHKRFMSKYVR